MYNSIAIGVCFIGAGFDFCDDGGYDSNGIIITDNIIVLSYALFKNVNVENRMRSGRMTHVYDTMYMIIKYDRWKMFRAQLTAF